METDKPKPADKYFYELALSDVEKDLVFIAAIYCRYTGLTLADVLRDNQGAVIVDTNFESAAKLAGLAYAVTTKCIGKTELQQSLLQLTGRKKVRL